MAGGAFNKKTRKEAKLLEDEKKNSCFTDIKKKKKFSEIWH